MKKCKKKWTVQDRLDKETVARLLELKRQLEQKKAS